MSVKRLFFLVLFLALTPVMIAADGGCDCKTDPPQDPVALYNYSVQSSANHEILLDASNSYDPDGSIVEFRWDTNNDGIFSDSTGSSSQAIWTIDTNGTYPVGLKVIDNDGRYDTTTVNIVVAWGGAGPGVNDVTVNSHNVQFTLWDCGNLEDGDQVDVSVNGSYVKENLVLSFAGITFDVYLPLATNSVIIHADNEGTDPPNTACIEISNVTTGEPSQSWNLPMGTDDSFQIFVSN